MRNLFVRKNKEISVPAFSARPGSLGRSIARDLFKIILIALIAVHASISFAQSKESANKLIGVSPNATKYMKLSPGQPVDSATEGRVGGGPGCPDCEAHLANTHVTADSNPNGQSSGSSPKLQTSNPGADKVKKK